MRRVYTFFLYLLTPLLIVRLLWKSRRLPAYRHRIKERFSIGLEKNATTDVWVHAVSLGEVNTACALIDKMLAMGLSVMVTTMTPTGSQRVQSVFAERVSHQYVPYDLPWLIRRFLKAINPKLIIIMETELWPNLIHESKRNKRPVFIANGRISDKAFGQYLKVRFLFKPILNELSGIITQSQADATRFIGLGAGEQRVFIGGNLKFDCPIPAVEINHFLFKKAWGDKRPVILAASTHHNEEEQLLSRLNVLKTSINNVLLIIAPRHPERFNDVYRLAGSMGFQTGRRSHPASIDERCDVVIIDSLGELTSFYQLSDYAFIGGSLVPVGGHNVLEPIALHVPVVTGPYNHNSKSVCKALLQAKAIGVAHDADDLVATIITLHQNQALKTEQVSHADRVLVENKGSLQRHLQIISGYLPLK